MLSLSASGDYGLRLLSVLARQPRGTFAKLRNVAQEHDLPLSYLSHLAHLLVAAEVLVSREGKHGGYALAEPADRMSLTRVLDALETGITPVRCKHDGSCCMRKVACERKTGWQTVHRELFSVLKSKTLADLLASVPK